MLEFIPRDNTFDSFDRAVKAWKKKCSKEGFLQELKDRRYFKKPSEKKREKLRKRKYQSQGEK